jgi:ABC-type antimicrobial peptide transport system permease subunit
VKDAKYQTLREQIPRTMYFHSLQGELMTDGFEIRTVGNAAAYAARVRTAIQSINGAIRVSGFETLADHVDSTLTHERLMVILCGLFAGLAGLLACIGLYGVTSYGVERRSGEIGIRVALGAQQSDILWMVQRETLRLVIVGVVIGVPTGILASRLISDTLFDLKPSDPGTIAAVSLLMTGVALLAGYLPARKASRLDPNQALRNQ